ncbi:MAG: O-antigen ligase family protein [Dehalococcoidales bacterium]|nr:O-antigen ligase family protein [Dehalococcoidales bacterium]
MLETARNAIRPPYGFDARMLAWAALVLLVSLPLAILPLTIAAALLAGVGAAILILARPHWALYMLAFSVPFESLKQLDLGGAAIGSTEALVGLLTVAWAVRLAATAERRPPRVALLRPLVLVLAAFGLATLRAVALPAAIKEGIRWLEILIVYLTASDLLATRGRRAVLLGLLLLAGAAEATIGFVQFLFRLGPDSFRTGGFLRAYGTFGQPNPYAGYLGTLLPLSIALVVAGWWDGRARRQVGFYALVVVLGLLGGALLASMSRGALLGLALAVAVMASLASRRAFLVLLAAALAGAVVMMLGAFDLLPSQISQRLVQVVSYFGVFDVRTVKLTPANWAIVERMAVWQAAWGMFEAHPFLGVGPGNYPTAYADFAMPGWNQAMGHAHNLYLNLLAETGVVGLGAFLVFWVAAIRAVWRRHRALGVGLTRWERAIPLGVLGVLAQVSLHNFFDNLMVHGLNVQLALLLALAIRLEDGEGKVTCN